MPESIENHSAERDDGSHVMKNPETPLEIEDLAVVNEDSSTVAKTIDEEGLVQILPEMKNILINEHESGRTDSSFVQGRMAGEKNGKYVRYGK